MKDFRQLRVWQKGLEIAIQTYRFSATLPKSEQFGLCSQMTRAAVSVPSNIAEGSSRSSTKDNHRFVEISMGSSFELETQLLIAQAVGLGDSNVCTILLQNLASEQRMLNAFQKSLNP